METELRDPDSILRYYKRLIRLRKEEPVIARGGIEFLFQDVPEVFAYRRFLGDEELFVVNNLTGHSVNLDGALWDVRRSWGTTRTIPPVCGHTRQSFSKPANKRKSGPAVGPLFAS